MHPAAGVDLAPVLVAGAVAEHSERTAGRPPRPGKRPAVSAGTRPARRRVDHGQKVIERPFERLNPLPPAAGSRYQAWTFQVSPGWT